MVNPTDQFTRNPFIDRVMKFIPDDPLTQSHYMYVLTFSVFVGLLGYASYAWFNVIFNFNWPSLFSGIFMLAIALISLFGLKQTRNGYLMAKALYPSGKKESNEAIKIDNVEEMLKSFKDDTKK